METLSIKIKISDRIYPMQVQPEDETFVRTASKMLAERIRGYQKKLGIQDQQDLLAMVAFDCLVAYLRVQEAEKTQTNALIQKIASWSDDIAKSGSAVSI
ncbi:Cell division protein ZapA [Cardinium endosymbiont of Sogatella furcifera]|uniref:cell division protein ZapA n=1 Tax=Cardinium endosymbiont of Sogatella furcifera TaxID=650378 RepID=UPI000E0D7F24|nr:cell division protein ZapA [Cardinium endosymbiont of Sogatella furcifera]AXI24074.1 Cell division protein ZapA [Cardinium endosymbiont of Sogatella furcifera]